MRFTTADLTITKIDELRTSVPMADVFPTLESADLRQLRRWYWSDLLAEDPAQAALEISCHSYLLQIAGRNVLIDTCNGNHKPQRPPFAEQLDTPYLQRLRQAGISPAQIDLVICTHLHFDHIGWNTRLDAGRWVPTFPHARYLFTRLDYEYVCERAADPLYGQPLADSLQPILERGLADLVETDHVVHRAPGVGIRLSGAPGHSPGSCIVHAQSGGALVLFTGDAFHHPVQLVVPNKPCAFDADPAEGAATRAALFAAHTERDTVLFPAHFGDPSGGRIRRDGTSYRFEFLTAA